MDSSTLHCRERIEQQRAACPCQSLVCAVREIARRAGLDLNHDDLTAALGMGWSPVAVATEPDLGLWPTYARDAFLTAAGGLFGLTVRDLHPPEAARGLGAAPEFAQHFDASYRPLIGHALEHQQPVLARLAPVGPHAQAWSVIRGVCNDGIGFTADVFRVVEGTGSCEPVVLTRPPVQLYVVERVAPRRPEPGALVELVLRHADIVWTNGCAERFGIVTGPGAYDLWLERLDARGEARAEVDRLLPAHHRLASASLTACESVIRCLERHRKDAAPVTANRLAGVIDGMRNVAQELHIAVRQELDTERDGEIRSALTRAREVTHALSIRQPA